MEHETGRRRGRSEFPLVQLQVVIAIKGILVAVLYSFSTERAYPTAPDWCKMV